MKSRIVLWGHRDTERINLRMDSPCANIEVFRNILSLAAERKWELGQMDVCTVLMQAQGFDREVYVIPPKEADESSICGS